MHKEDCFYLGSIVGKFSFKGELLLKLDSNDPAIYKNLSTLFIDMEAGLVPFFVISCRLHKSHLLRLKLNEVDDEQTANSLIKKEVFLPLDLLPPLEGTQFYYHEVLDFKVFDGQHLIGSIVGFQDNQGQDLLEVQDKEQKKILIPVHYDFIHTLNRKKKEMVINLPEGFLDLF